MRPYEMMLILAPDIPEEELDPSIDTIETYITNQNGSVVIINQDSPWGRRRLAYPIRHQGHDVRDGFYTLWYFDAEPTAIVEIERELRLNDRIIRHMIVSLDEQVTLIPIEPPAAEGSEAGETAAADAVTPDGDAPTAQADTAEAADAPVETEAEATADASGEVDTTEADTDTAAATDVAPEASADETPAEDAGTDETTTKE